MQARSTISLSLSSKATDTFNCLRTTQPYQNMSKSSKDTSDPHSAQETHIFTKHSMPQQNSQTQMATLSILKYRLPPTNTCSTTYSWLSIQESRTIQASSTIITTTLNLSANMLSQENLPLTGGIANTTFTTKTISPRQSTLPLCSKLQWV
jgi:hypothetical protein